MTLKNRIDTDIHRKGSLCFEKSAKIRCVRVIGGEFHSATLENVRYTKN